jgi:hypothetical protein
MPRIKPKKKTGTMITGRRKRLIKARILEKMGLMKIV